MGGMMDTIQVVIMGEAEARLLVEEIKTGAALVSDKLLELYDREGWRALGYQSWQDCVMAEFDLSHGHIYRLLGFAQVKQNILESPIGDSVILPTKEAQARPLTKLPKDQQPIAWISAVRDAGGQPSAKQVERIVKEIKPITKESQTKWGPKAAYSSSDNQTSRGDDTSQVTEDDIDQTGSPKHHKSREEQAAIGLLETLGYSVIPPEAAGDPTCAYCGKPFK